MRLVISASLPKVTSSAKGSCDHHNQIQTHCANRSCAGTLRDEDNCQFLGADDWPTCITNVLTLLLSALLKLEFHIRQGPRENFGYNRPATESFFHFYAMKAVLAKTVGTIESHMDRMELFASLQFGDKLNDALLS